MGHRLLLAIAAAAIVVLHFSSTINGQNYLDPNVLRNVVYIFRQSCDISEGNRRYLEGVASDLINRAQEKLEAYVNQSYKGFSKLVDLSPKLAPQDFMDIADLVVDNAQSAIPLVNGTVDQLMHLLDEPEVADLGEHTLRAASTVLTQTQNNFMDLITQLYETMPYYPFSLTIRLTELFDDLQNIMERIEDRLAEVDEEVMTTTMATTTTTETYRWG